MRALSLKAGLEESTVKKIFSNSSGNTTIRTVEKLAKGLNCSPVELLPEEWSANGNINYHNVENAIKALLPIFLDLRGTKNETSIDEFTKLVTLMCKEKEKTGNLPSEAIILKLFKN